MSSACCKVLLCMFAVTWIFLPQSTNGARNDRRCSDLLRRLLRNPPNNTKVAINIGLSKARYLCREGFKLVGMEIRTCKGGKWKENIEPKCLKPCGKPEDIPHSKVVGSSFNFNDQLRYKCIKGYTLTGPRLRSCGDDGKWSKTPRCEERVPCGQSLVNVRARIVGGTISQRGMWPWQIALYRINKNVPQFFCGGALVSRRWVLTAAHCFYDLSWGLFIGNANLYLIKVGDHNLSVNETLQQEIVPERIFVHPRFKPKGLPFFDGDIALVKLSREVELSKFVRTVCLPEKDESDLAIPKTRGTVAGWGITRPLRRGEYAQLSEISKVLRHASFPIQSEQLCVKKSGIQFNTTTAFCAGNGRGGEDTCGGDSGGAFVREGNDSKWVVIGVVSWGNGCAQKDQYGYYTRIHPFLDWITETMNEKKESETNKPKSTCSSETTRQQRRRGINLNEDCGLDLVFLFDASVSVNRYYFQTSLEFAKELLTVIGASKRAARTQVAAVSEAKLEFNLGDSEADTIDKAIKAIDNIMYVGWVSSYIRPFKLVRNKVAPNTRNDSHQVMMFITDGLDLSGSVRREAKYLRDNKHFEVYAIGIGRKVNTRALMSIASVNQDHNHVISVRKYRNLQDAVQRVVHMDIVSVPKARRKKDYSPCGVSPVDFRARIVGGKMSKRRWWPWQIGLYKNNDEVPPKLELICGGALISRRWILTAAHCFYHFNPIFGKYEFKRNTQEYLVKAGDYNLLREERSQQDINPEKFFVYEDYMDRKFVNDIALIKLKEEVELSPFVRTLCLPEKNEGDLAIPTKHGFATGWGTTQALKPGENPERENRYSTRLQYSAYTIQSDQLCAKRSVIAVNSTVSFCAGDGKGGNDTCLFDSGGAFIREGRRGEDYRWVATGLVSWGLGCAQKDQYGYYTRVYPFTDWIKKTMEENTKADE